MNCFLRIFDLCKKKIQINSIPAWLVQALPSHEQKSPESVKLNTSELITQCLFCQSVLRCCLYVKASAVWRTVIWGNYYTCIIVYAIIKSFFLLTFNILSMSPQFLQFLTWQRHSFNRFSFNPLFYFYFIQVKIKNEINKNNFILAVCKKKNHVIQPWIQKKRK